MSVEYIASAIGNVCIPLLSVYIARYSNMELKITNS